MREGARLHWLQPEPGPVRRALDGAPLTDQAWYPFFEKMVELDVPAMVHVRPAATATSTPPARTTLTPTPPLSCSVQGDLFKDFPNLRFIIPHGGGAVPYHWGRYRGLADMMKKPPLREHVMKNVFFDTCVYHQPGIDLLFEVIDATTSCSARR